MSEQRTRPEVSLHDLPAPSAAAHGCTRSPSGERSGQLLLALSCLIFLAAALRNISTPWENGMRGVCGSTYSDGAVAQTLAYGLGVTLGTPAFIVVDDGQLIRNVNWHHPPLYWLFLSGCASLFGHETWLLRLVQIVLFVPGLLALFALVRRWSGGLVAGITTLLFATNPVIAYFGPMVLQDGAVLSFGLVTMWNFDRHIVAPTRRSWWRTAASFFVLTSLDYPGYFWGIAMFAMALASPGQRRAIRSVFSFVPVSVLAFLVMAVHYGLALGGPLAFLESLSQVFAAEGQQLATQPIGPRVLAALQELLLGFGTWPCFVLAALGSTLAMFSRTGSARRLALLGLALLVPGVCCEVAMFSHALEHVFWPMQGFAGLAVLGAIVPVAGAELRATGRAVGRAASAMLFAATLGTALAGSAWTHVVIGRFEFVENGSMAVIKKALPHLDGCSTVLTSAPFVTHQHYGRSSVFYSITAPEILEQVLRLGRAMNTRGTIGFVVHPGQRNSPLTRLLDSMAPPLVVDDIVVYRFRL